MEHRGDVQHHVVLEGAVRPHELEPVRGDVPVGEPDPLGAAGGPSGIEQQRIVAFDAGPPRVLRRSVAKRFVDGIGIAPAVLADPQPRLPPPGEHGVGREPGQVVLHREQARRSVVEDGRDLARGEPVVDGHRGRAHPVAGVDELGLARVVAAEDGEAVPGPYPERSERPRRPPHPDRELRPGERAALARRGRHDGGVRREVPFRPLDECPHRDHGRVRSAQAAARKESTKRFPSDSGAPSGKGK